MNCLLYARARTDNSATTKKQIQNQFGRLQERAIHEGWTVVGMYADEQVSACAMERQGLRQLLQICLDRDDVHGVLVTNIDRLVRSVSDLATILKTLTARHIVLASLEDNGEMLNGHIKSHRSKYPPSSRSPE